MVVLQKSCFFDPLKEKVSVSTTHPLTKHFLLEDPLKDPIIQIFGIASSTGLYSQVDLVLGICSTSIHIHNYAVILTMDQLNSREQQEFQQLVERKQMKDFMRECLFSI